MPDTINIGTVAISTAAAEAELKKLEKALGDTVDRSGGLERALASATARVEQQRQAFATLKPKVEDAGRAAEKAQEAFARGGFGSEAAERVKHFADAIELARGNTERFGGGTVSAGQRTQALVGAVAMAARGVAGVAMAAVQGVSSLLQMAAAAEENARAERNLGSALGEVERQTRGAVTAQEALTERQTLVAQGVQTTDQQLGLLTRAGREFANQFGGNAAEAMGYFNAALSGDAGAQRRIAQLGIDLRGAGSEGERARLLFDQLNHQFHDRPPVPETAHEQVNRYQRTWNNFTNNAGGNFLRWLATAGSGMGDAQEIIEHVNGGIMRGVDAVQRRLHAAEQQRQEDAQRTANAAKEVTRAFEEQRRATDPLTDAMRRLGDVYRADELELEGFYRRMDAGREVIGLQRQRRRDQRALARNLLGSTDSTGARITHADLQRAGIEEAGGGPSAQQLADLRREAKEATAEVRTLNDEWMGVARHTHETTEHWYRRVVEESRQATARLRAAQAEFDAWLDERRQRADELRGQAEHVAGVGGGASADLGEQVTRATQNAMSGTARQLEAQQREAAQRAAEANDTSHQFQLAFQADAAHTQTAAQRMAQGVAGAWNTMSGAATAHFKALITGKESASQALEGFAKDAVASLAEQGFAQMLTNLAAGVTALATVGGAAAAPGFFAAAAAWGAVAALGGAASAAMSGGGSSASASAQAAGSGVGAPPATAGGSGGAGGGGNVTYNINVNGALATREDIGDAIRHAQNRNALRGQMTSFERAAINREMT